MKRIGFKFASAIMVLALIGIISLGILANSLTAITTGSQQVMNNEVEKINLIHGIYEDYLDMYMNVYAHINAKLLRSMDKKSEAIMESREEMWQYMEAYRAGITSAEVEETYALLESRLRNFDSYVDAVLEASREDDKERANALVANNLGMLNGTIDTNMNKLLEYSAAELDSSKAVLRQQADQSYTVIIVVIVLLVVAAVLVTIIAIRVIVVPIRKIATAINGMIEDIHNGQGSLTERVPVQTKDEISTLAKGVNEFLDILQEMIGGVISCGEEIDLQQKSVNEVVEETNRSASETSATMQQLAASIQEVSATAAYVNENTRQAQESVGEMVDKAVNGTKFAEEIRSRAEELRKLAQESKETASQMIREFDVALQASIEDSHQIENIGSLTGDILSIASKTNLLALNASIEAARAGEMGKGFNVVAEEVRVLASNSKQASDAINGIIQKIFSLLQEVQASNQENIDTVTQEIEKLHAVEAEAERIGTLQEESKEKVRVAAGSSTDTAQRGEQLLNMIGQMEQLVENTISQANQIVEESQTQKNVTGEVEESFRQVNDVAGNLLRISQN